MSFQDTDFPGSEKLTFKVLHGTQMYIDKQKLSNELDKCGNTGDP